jgi:hypothetical protein
MPANIYFFGLICHISPDENDPDVKTHAAVVSARDHTPMIWGFRDGKLDVSNLSSDVFVQGGGFAVVEQSFRSAVPGLRRMSGGGELATPVQHGNPHDGGVHAYVHFPGRGRLHASELYPLSAVYGSIEMCVAKVTRLELFDSVSPIPGYGFQLDNSHDVLIMNASRGEGTPGHRHNQEYQKLLRSGMVAPAEDGRTECPTDLEQIPAWITGVITAWASTDSSINHGADRHDETKEPAGELRAAVRAHRMTLRVECANTNWP